MLLVAAGSLSVYFESYAQSNFDVHETKTHNSDNSVHTVSIKIVNGASSKNNDQFFVPENATATVGSTVTWINNDDVAHTATSIDSGFDTGIILPSKSASISVTKQGVIEYKCSIHPWMKGTVHVI